MKVAVVVVFLLMDGWILITLQVAAYIELTDLRLQHLVMLSLLVNNYLNLYGLIFHMLDY